MPHPFEFILLTNTKEVQGRHWRNFAASFAAHSGIFYSADEFLKHCEIQALNSALPTRKIIFYDQSLGLADNTINHLKIQSYLFVDHAMDSRLPATTKYQLWQKQGIYLRTDLTTLPSSHLFRLGLSLILQEEIAPVSLNHLLRWGYSQRTWKHDKDQTPSSQSLIDYLHLDGTSQETPMSFKHFCETKLIDLGAQPIEFTYGSDGLLVAASVRCEYPGQATLIKLSEALSSEHYPLCLLKGSRQDNTLEISSLSATLPQTTKEEIFLLISDLLALKNAPKAVEIAIKAS